MNLPLNTRIDIEDLALGNALLRQLRVSLPHCTERPSKPCASSYASSTRSASGESS